MCVYNILTRVSKKNNRHTCADHTPHLTITSQKTRKTSFLGGISRVRGVGSTGGLSLAIPLELPHYPHRTSDTEDNALSLLLTVEIPPMVIPAATRVPETRSTMPGAEVAKVG